MGKKTPREYMKDYRAAQGAQGRRERHYYLTDDEHVLVTVLIKQARHDEQTAQQRALLTQERKTP